MQLASTLFRLIILISLISLSYGNETPLEGSSTIKELLENQEQQINALEDIDGAANNKSTPRLAIANFLKASKNEDYSESAKHMDFRYIPKTISAIPQEDLARKLYKILSNTTWIDLSDISNDPQGFLDDGLAKHRDRVSQLKIGKKSYEILLQRIPTDGGFTWKISNATVKNIPHFYQHYGIHPFGEWLELKTPSYILLGAELWLWIFFLSAFIGIYLLLIPPTWGATLLVKRSTIPSNYQLPHFIRGPLMFFITVIIYRVTLSSIQMPVTARAIWEGASLLMIALWWLLLGSIDLYVRHVKLHWQSQQLGPTHLLGPAKTALKILITLIIGLIWMEQLGFSAATILTGLGIGGIAIALAAQKTVENIIGAIILYTSKPIRVGDICRLGPHIGTVEEIGLRSTLIRTLQRTSIHIPNAKLADMELENISERESICYQMTIQLSYKTTSQKLENIKQHIYTDLEKNPQIKTSPLRVHLGSFGDFGYEMVITAYVDTINFDTYLNVAEKLNLTISKFIEQEEAELISRLN